MEVWNPRNRWFMHSALEGFPEEAELPVREFVIDQTLPPLIFGMADEVATSTRMRKHGILDMMN